MKTRLPIPIHEAQGYQLDSEQLSEALIEQLDSNYEPNDREIREYATQTLGMRLPEDQALLYLAKEGLKAPLPPNWSPYQGRDGEVYYKHRITQEKTYNHPTDMEYLKKYNQMKEQMARKGLKSMNSKAEGKKNMFEKPNLESNLSMEMEANSKITQFQGELKSQLARMEQNMKQEWVRFEREERESHAAKLAKYKEDYQAAIASLSKVQPTQAVSIKLEKERLKENLERNLNEELQEENKEHIKSLEANQKEFLSVYSEDQSIKIRNYLREKEQQLSAKQAVHSEAKLRHQEAKEKKKREMEQALQTLARELQAESNAEIKAALHQCIAQEIASIHEESRKSLEKYKANLEAQFSETRKLLGYDSQGYLTDIAQKKARMRKMSIQKLESLKNKEINLIKSALERDLENAMKKVKSDGELEGEREMENLKKAEESRLVRAKERIDQEFTLKTQRRIEQIYGECSQRVGLYQTDMNKKLAQLQSTYIQEIQAKSASLTDQLTLQMEIKAQQQQLEHRQMMVVALRRQMELDKCTLASLQLNRWLHVLPPHQIDSHLQQMARSYQITTRPEAFWKAERTLQEYRCRYKSDKEVLASMMLSMQNKRGGSVMVLKQYNEDVRNMRINEETIHKMAILLKKAELNGKEAIRCLEGDFSYIPITIREEEVLKARSNTDLPVLGESYGQREVESKLREHGQFLKKMRQDLNRKLYQARSTTYCNTSY